MSDSPISGTWGSSITGSYTIAAGTIDTVVYAGATFGNGTDAVLVGPGTLESSGYVYVDNSGGNVELLLAGGVNWYNGGTVYQGGVVQFGTATGDSATIVNQAGAIYDLTTNNSQIEVPNSGTYSFVNAGLLEMTGGGSDGISAPVTNSGLITANNGNLYLADVTNSGTLVGNAFMEVEGGVLGGTIEGNVALVGTYAVPVNTTDTVMFGSPTFEGALLEGPGTLQSNGAVYVLNSGGNVELELAGGVTFDNVGVVYQAGVLLYGTTTGDTATIVNQAGATWDLTTNNSQVEANNPGTYSFVNDGVLEMTGGGSDTVSVPLTNNGLVTANNGNLYFAGPFTNSGTLQTDGGFLQLEGGVLGGTIQGNVAITATYTVAANTTDTVAFGGATFEGAAVEGAGTLVSDGYVYSQNNGGNVTLELGGGVTLENAGAFYQAGVLLYGTAADDSATIVNQAGATWDLDTNNSQQQATTPGTYGFVNDGLLEMTGGGSDTVSVPLTNSGVVSANNGNLYVTELVSNSGTLQTNGGFLELQGGVLGGLIQGNVALIGSYLAASDTVVTVTFGAGVTLGDGPDAVFDGPGTLVTNGQVNITNNGGNVQLVLADGLTWENAASVTQGGILQFGGTSGDTATLFNDAGATWSLTTGNSQLEDDGTGTYSLINAGLLQMVGGGTNTMSPALTNTGVVSANNGSFVIAGGFTNSGTLQSNGGLLYLEGGVLGGTIQVDPQHGGAVYMSGTYAVAAGTPDDVTFGSVFFGDGNAAVLSGSGTLSSVGAVTVYQNGGYAQLFLSGGVTWDNDGTVNQNGAIQFGTGAADSATIVNEAGATYELTSGNAQVYAASGGGSYSFINDGLLEMIGGGTNTIYVPLSNNGVVTANNGTFVIAGSFSNTGTIETGGGAMIIEGGTLGGSILANNGPLYLLYTYGVAIDTAVTFNQATFGDGTAATLAGPATLTTNGELNVYQNGGYAQLLLTGGITWDNDATVNQNGAIELGTGSSDSTNATIVNEAGATYELTSGNAQIYAGGTGSYSFVNDGLLKMIGGGTNTISVPLTNNGVVSANNGTFIITDLASNTGTLETGGGTMFIEGGTLGGSILANNGPLYLLYTYGVAIDAAVTFNQTTFGDGTAAILAGPATLTTTGELNVYQNGGNAQLLLTGGITWDNDATVNQNGAIEFGTSGSGSTNATIVNEAGATYELTSGNAQIYAGGTGTYSFVDDGLLTMTGGGTNSIDVAVDETSTGTITASNGTLDFDDGATIGGAVNGGQPINFYGNVTLTATGDITASNVSFNSGTLFMQGGTINSPNLTLGSGEHVVGYGALGDPAISAIIIDASGGLLTVTGPVNGVPDYEIETGSTLELTNGSSRPVTFNGTDATLKLDSEAGYSGTINNFAGGDTIDLPGITLSAVSYVGGHLIGTLAAGGTISLNAPAVAPGQQLELGTNATGGSTIYLQPSTVEAIPDLLTALGPNNSLVLPDAHIYVPVPTDPTLEIENAATAPADGLNVSVVQTTGSAYATGEINSLAPQAIDDSSINVGLNDETAGHETGSVALAYATNGSVSGVSGSAGTAATFTEFDLSPYVNSYFNGQVGNTGYLANGSAFGPIIGNTTGNQGTGIPFLVASTPGNFWYGLDSTSSVTVPVGISASTVYTLTDNLEGTTGADEYSVTFTPVSGSPITEQYVGGVNTKDYNDNPNTDGTDTTPQAAYWFVDGSGQWLQEVAWNLPAGFGTLASVTMTQESARDGALFAGLTVGTGSSDLGTQTLNLSDNVYRLADPSITAPSNVYLHVGDDGGTATEALTIANTDPADGYSEGLDAAATGTVTGNLLSASGSTGDIAAGGSNSSSLTVSFSTATAGYVSGSVGVAETSDGAGVDTLGLTPLDGATYSAVNNFSTVSNANGVWSYLSDGSLLADAGSGTNYERWSNGGSIPDSASVTENTTTTTQTYSNTIVLPPNYLNLDPESVGNVAVQFTAPTAGVYTFTGDFAGTDVDENGHTVAVVVNGTTAESGTISSYGQMLAIGLTETLAAGATVDFVSNSGASYNNLSVGLSVNVTTGAGASVPVTATIDNYATAALSIQQVAATNIVQNGGFEANVGADPDDWTTNAAYNLEAGGFNQVLDNPGLAVSGNNLLQFGDYDYQGLAGISQTLTTVAGATYTATFDVKYGPGAGADGNALFQASVDGTNDFAVTGGAGAPSNWTQESFNFVGTGSDTLAFGAQTSPSEWYLDDISVVEDSTPVTNGATVDLGTFAQGPGENTQTLYVGNSAAGPADWLTGSLSASASTAITDTGLGSIGSVAAGTSLPVTIDLSTVNSGVFTQTITLAADSTNPDGSTPLPGETVTVTGTVVSTAALAQAVINEPSPIVLPDAHVVSLVPNDQLALDISNTGSDVLSGFASSATGSAYGSGIITDLAAGASDTTGIMAGLNNTQAGSLSGTVNLSFTSGTNDVALPSQTVSLEGNVYNYATAAISGPADAIVHVGAGVSDTDSAALVVRNVAAAGGYSENLDATALSVASGDLTGAGGTASEIAAGGTNTTAATFSFSTATAGTVSGQVAVQEISDGSTIDTLGTTALGTVDVPVSVTVNNYATAAIQQTGGAGDLAQTGSVYTLNLGDVAQGTGSQLVGLDIANTATGPADWLTGSLSSSGSPAITAYNASASDALSVTYFEVSDTGNGPDFGGSGVPNVAAGSTLGPDGLPVASTPAGVADVDPSTQEITWWDPSLNSGIVETGTGVISLPFGSNMYAPNSTGSNDGTYFETAILQGTFSLESPQSVTFQVGSDDDSFIYVDGTLIGQNPGIHGNETQNFTAANLAAGTHTIEIFYDDRQQSGANLNVNVLTPGVTIVPLTPGTLEAIGTLNAGATSPLAVDLNTANAGTFTTTVTLAATDGNAAGFSEALPTETLVVTGTVLPGSALANPVIDTPTPIVLPDAHVAAVENDQTLLSIENTGSAVLSGVVTGATGNAYGSGAFNNLPIGATDTTDIAVGLNNTSAGAKSGSVSLEFSSGENLVTNGSFEDAAGFVDNDGYPDTMLVPAGSTVMPGWTVVSEPLAWIGAGNNYGLSPEDGSYFLDLTGSQSGPPFSGISQTIATAAGDQYQLSFELGSASQWGLPDGVTASAAGTSETFTSTESGTNNWQQETLDFTATGSTTAISLVGASGNAYIGVDNVSVTPEGTSAPVSLAPQTVAVSGNVYRLATASITGPSNVILHVGNGGSTVAETLTVTNTDPNDHYSEGLEVAAVGGSGEVASASGTTGDIVAQGTDDTSLIVNVSTAAAATSGTVVVQETSDGTNVDSLGTTSLGTVDVPIYVIVDNYASAAMEQTGGDGSLIPNATPSDTYTLNLGSTEQNASPLTASLAALNAALGPAADQLDGSYTISGDSEYGDTGFGSFGGVNYGSTAGGNTVELNTGTIGTFTQQITLTPTGTNSTGYSGTLATETIDVVGTIVPVPPPPPPPLATAIAWGDVHLTTFDGLYYNFQAEGEFVLAQSTVSGDTFAVQARMAPYSANSTVSVMTMIGANVGGEQVTFGLGRDDVVAIGGVGQTFAGNGSSIALAGGGSITQLTSTSYQLNWGTGEVMDVTDAGTYFNLNLTLSAADGPGSVQGLLGSDTGQANDFQLANGTVLAQPLTSAELYGEFADAWRVTSGPGGNSLMDYLNGQNTATFTDDNFPADSVNVDNLPAAILQEAELEVQQAGITDPNQQAAAVLDLLVTGNPNALLDDVDVGQNGQITTAAEISVPPPPVPALGVSAVATNVIETAGGTTEVTFNAYLTSPSGTDTVIDWAVTSPNATYLTASSLGSNTTSSFVVIPAGQTTGQFTVTLPTGVLGPDPSANLQVSISSTNGDPVFGQTAQTEIDNYQPVPGNPAIPQLTLASGSGTFSGSDGDFTLNLGTLVAGESPLQDRFQIANDALAPSDLLAGSITASGNNFTVYGATQLSPLGAGTSDQGLVTEANTSQTGAQSETIVFTPVDENITGYSSIQATQTVTITDTVLADAVGDLLTSGPINLGSLYEGSPAQVPLSIENAAGGGSAGLDVTASSSGQATATGIITGLGPSDLDTSSIDAGINTSTPGVQTGYVTLNYASDAGNGNVAAGGSATIEVIGTVYGPAVATFSAPPVYVHQGQDGGSVVVPITISNTAPVGDYSENLDAQVVSFGTYVTAASGSVVDLAAGHSNNTALTATLSDADPGTFAGEVLIDLQSDGTGIDNKGTTLLAVAYVQAAIDVDQYAVAAMEEISGNGTMVPTGVSTSYSLDLGTVAQYATPLGANLGVLNDVLGQSDLLAGSFNIAGAPEFTNAGFGAFGSGTEIAGLAAQQVDSDPVVVLSSGTVGVFTETVTLDPIGYNPSGYSGTLTPETVTITGTVVAAPLPTPVARVADGWGDVHLTTFDGLYYNFQAAGEFVLTESTIPGNTFEIQARMQPYGGSSSVSVNTMIAAEVGNDRVTFGIDRTDTVWIDGQGVSLSSDPVVTLADGTLEQTSADTWRLVWNTGEELDVTNEGAYLNVTVSLPSSDDGHVQGLLGNNNGNPANDLTLPNGTPIETNGSISYAQLYGTYAASWEVTGSTSLMDYQVGQDAASFYNPNFPYNQILLGNLPPNAYQEALAAAEAAGITDPNLLQAAIVDYLFTGNPQALAASENVQQQEGSNNTSGQTVTAAPPPVADVGVLANEATVVELTGTADAIGFTAYLTSPEATNTLIDFSVNGNAGPGFLNASNFPGDILPSGTVTIAAGATTAVFTVAIPANVLGSKPDENLQVVISPQNPEQSVFAPEAQTEILNTGPTPGNPATPLVELLSGDGVLTGSGTGYELNLGSVEQFSNPLLAGYGVENDGIVPADLLSGSFEVSASSQFLNSGLAPFAPIATGNADSAPEVELLTNEVGTFTENVTLTPTDSNLTNYSSVMPQVTIEVVGTITAPPPPPPPPAPEATAWGDVHLTTFDGVYYNFQAAGEYVLTRSTVAGDTFQVQARLVPWGANSSVTVQTQVGAAIGSDDVVFALTGASYNASPLYLNGSAEALGVGQTLSLSDGSVTETSTNTYRVNWDTGESMTVTLNGSYISDTIELTAADAGKVQGLLGPDDGNPSTDLQLPDGQSIASNGTVSSSNLYGEYATAWQVPDTANSLLYYTGDQSPSTFLIPGFPEDALTLSQLPANLVAAAEAIVEAEGITNPNLVDAAVIDLLVTGDPNSVFSSENVQEEGVLLNSAAVSIPTPLPSVGILADSTTALEPTSGTLAVDYTIYLTAASAQTSTVDYSVTGSGPNNLGTADIVGGTGSGVVQIAAGQTSTQIVVDVLANALGTQPDAELQVSVTPTGGETLFGGSAETEIVNPAPTAGNPAVALVEQLAGDGHLSGGGTDYVLNLGTQVQNGSDLYANVGIENAATVPADGLSGQFTITDFENFLNTGFVPFSNVAPGAADTEPAISLGTGTIGVYTEQVVLDPTDTNDSGYSQPQNDVTLTVTGTIVPMPLAPPPSMPTATAWGDVHLTTFDGLYYNFQAVGEFTLAKSTVANDSFNVQIRTTQYGGSSVSVIDQVAAGFGNNQNVTFGTSASQPATVLLNGGAANFVNGVLTLTDGTVTEESPSSYVVNWNTGESMTVNVAGSYINTTVALAAQDENGHVEGLLGYDNGVNNDFAPIVSGTTITTNQLYYGSGDPGVADSLADYWRVAQADSLLYYAPGTFTSDYTNVGFPADALSLADLPTALQQEGLQEAIQAGITDPQLQQAAALDFIVTGDPNIVTGGQNVQQQGITTTDSDVTGAVVTPALGVSANNAALVEPASGNLDVGFTVYLTEAEAQASTVDWSVDAPNSAYLDASDFAGDILPSGSIIIAAGSTSASFSVEVNAGVLGALPSSDLQVMITPTGTEAVFAPTAQTTIVNKEVEPGTPSDPLFALLSGEGTLTQIGNAYTLDLGTLSIGASEQNLSLAIENAAAAGSNSLAGALTATSIPGFTVSGTGPLPVIAAGDSYQGLHVAVNTTEAGDYSETITFTPVDQNASGYSSQGSPLTLTIDDSVSGEYASASAVAPNPVNFGTVHVGAVLSRALSITNTGSETSSTEKLDGSIGSATGAATTNGGSFTGLAAGFTNSTSLSVGLSTATDGVQSGSATISLESDGTGIDSNGTTDLPSQNVDVFGTVYAYAAPELSTLTTLVGFNGANGEPKAGLVADSNGDLFGMTTQGGTNNLGTVFELVNHGGGSYTPTTLLNFTPSLGDPSGSLITDSNGDLFGATFDNIGSNDTYLDGTVFEIVHTGTGYAAAPTVLAGFNTTTTGISPTGGLLADAHGDLFGTTALGGGSDNNGDGTVFEIANTATGYASTPITLASFGGANGATPSGGLIADANGDLFGTTSEGGANGNNGSVFEIINTATGYANTPTTLVSFDRTDGADPVGGLLADSYGDLFGTTEIGGEYDNGTVFELVDIGGSYTLTTLASFGSVVDSGSGPSGGLITDSNGDLFGETAAGGTDGYGAVFEIANTATGYESTPVTLVSFNSVDGDEPLGNLLADTHGDLFGTTFQAGPSGDGTVFELADSGIAGTGTVYTLNFGATRVGGTVAAQSLTISNGTTADPYQESLIYALQNTPPTGFIAGSGDSGTIVSGSTALASLNLKTTTAGNFSATDTLTFTSTGLGTSGLANTTLTGDAITLEGKVYAAAVADLTSTTLNFGIVHVGSTTKGLSIKNTGSGALTDVLIGNASTVTGTGFSSTGSLGAGVAAGGTGSLNFVLNSATSGVFSGSATLALASHDPYQADLGLTVSPITLIGTVDNYATAAISEVSGEGTLTQSGHNYTLNLNTLSATSSPVVIDLAVNNTAIGLSDLLSGSFTEAANAAFINSGFAAFSGVGAGQTATIAPSITLGPGNFGTFTETFTLAAEGSNASGYSGTLTPETLTVTGMVLPVIDLTSTPSDVVNGAGNVTIVATSSELFGSDQINGGGGTNTLDLQGGGIFNLATPKVLTNIQVVNATEGQGSALPNIFLRNGLNVTLNLLDPVGGAVVHGANDDDIINLGSGNDTVYLGSAGETVHGGSGTDTYSVTAATIGATIDGGTGTNYLYVQGGGTAAMGISNITGINAVFLENAGNSYNFTVNTTHGMVIHASADSDTITVGYASQTVIGSSGSLVVEATAANAGVAVRSGSGSNTLEITTGGSIALNSALANITVELEAAVTLSLPTTTSVVIDGIAGDDVFVATAGVLRAGQSITGGGSSNTLELQGGGIFHLDAPATLANIQVVDATEGQGTALPNIFLRNGLDLTLNLASAATNPQSAGAVVHGAANNDVINLGAGNDTVYLGGTGETVHGGSGTDTFSVTAATIGATIDGGTGTNYLYVQGGGIAAMGTSDITGINAVFLENAGTSYNFTANATHGMVIHASADSDTITVGDASQTVIGSSGSLVVEATAANSDVAVRSGSGSNTLEITTGGSIALNSGLANITVELEQATTLALLTNATVVIDGIAGDDVFVATAGVLRAGQSITGGGTDNELELQGGGIFSLNAPTTLSNIQVVDATEGQGTALPNIFLRSGLDLTLNLASAATNPQSAGAVVHGAANNDVINLGSGNDTVYLGGTGETVHGGSGTDTFSVTAATIGATIDGGTGTNYLYVQGGGIAAMGTSDITGINGVFLENAGTSYNFTANATHGMVIHASADSDTITVGDASQTVIGSSGSLDVLATAANAGVAVRSGSGSNELDITSTGTTALNSGDNNLTVKLDAANTTLTLDHMKFIYAVGSGAGDVIVAGAAGQTLTGGGGNDTLEDAGHYGVTFQDTITGIEGDTLADFSKLDTIDITNLSLGSVTGTPVYTGGYGNTSSGTLAVPTSSGTIDIKLTGLASGGVFSATSDSHGGTFITYT